MADYEHTQPGVPGQDMPPAEGGLTLTTVTHVTGALLSLALVIGVGVWSYKLLMRDVSGVPVVRALAGEMRVAPKNPGGEAADHQGLAVNAVAARGAAAPPADRIKLAPRPVELTDEDAPMTGDRAAPRQNGDLAAAAPADADAPAPSGAAVAAFQEGDVDALVAELTRGVDPMQARADTGADSAPIVQPEALDPAGQPESLPEPVSGTEAEAPAETVIDPADIKMLTLPGVKRSPRPRPRPDGLQLASADPEETDAMAAAISSAVDTAAGLDVDPATLSPGTRLAQLGAFDSPDIARTEWDRIAARFEDYIVDKSRVIQQATSGGRTFYRLRAMGFDDLSDARRFCSALVAGGVDCIPVTVR